MNAAMIEKHIEVYKVYETRDLVKNKTKLARTSFQQNFQNLLTFLIFHFMS